MSKVPKIEKSKVLWHDRKHWAWFPFSFTSYEVKNERLYVKRGFLHSTYDETLLYRVTDIQLSRTLGQKFFGTGTVTITTRVDSIPEIHLENIKNSVKVKEYLSDLIERIRSKKNVVGKEFYGSVGHPGPPHGGPDPMMMDLDDSDGDGIPDMIDDD